MASDEITQDLQFEKQIEGFTTEGKFLARQLREVKQDCVPCKADIVTMKADITTLQGRDRKAFGWTGGVGVGIGSLITFLIEYFTKKGQ